MENLPQSLSLLTNSKLGQTGMSVLLLNFEKVYPQQSPIAAGARKNQDGSTSTYGSLECFESGESGGARQGHPPQELATVEEHFLGCDFGVRKIDFVLFLDDHE